MILRSRYVYAVRWISRGKSKWRQKEFNSEREAKNFAKLLPKPPKAEYQILKAWKPTLLRRLLEAKLLWRGWTLPLWPLPAGVLLGALARWIVSRAG